ncbi:MAG: hypothetical protein VX486_10000, partial [Pseudomonadota bacterium]|nr:hypothetical protein [Pseudomonadota bacterium]
MSVIRLMTTILTLIAAVLLSSCGGSSGSGMKANLDSLADDQNATESSTSSQEGWVEGVFEAP